MNSYSMNIFFVFDIYESNRECKSWPQWCKVMIHESLSINFTSVAGRYRKKVGHGKISRKVQTWVTEWNKKWVSVSCWHVRSINKIDFLTTHIIWKTITSKFCKRSRPCLPKKQGTMWNALVVCWFVWSLIFIHIFMTTYFQQRLRKTPPAMWNFTTASTKDTRTGNLPKRRFPVISQC